MTIGKCAVAVKQLPETLSVKQERIFLREIRTFMNTHSPYMVLDCSTVRRMDSSVVHLLLCCLEEAMKRNGDVKLAALPDGAGAVLELTGVNRLFDIYDTAADAVNSFHQLPGDRTSQTPVPVRSQQEPESAASPVASITF